MPTQATRRKATPTTKASAIPTPTPNDSSVSQRATYDDQHHVEHAPSPQRSKSTARCHTSPPKGNPHAMNASERKRYYEELAIARKAADDAPPIGNPAKLPTIEELVNLVAELRRRRKGY